MKLSSKLFFNILFVTFVALIHFQIGGFFFCFLKQICFFFTSFEPIRSDKSLKAELYVKPSKKKFSFFNFKLRKIIRSKKGIQNYKINSLLRTFLMNWGMYHRSVHSTAYLNNLDSLLFQKLRSWVFRNTKARNKKKQFFFPENRNWLFNRQIFSTRWILFFFKIKKKRSQSVEKFLPQLGWISSINHKKLTTHNNLFDGNLSYWKFRFIPRKGEF